MIFIILGTQKFQFNRILKEIDNLIESGIILEKVIAQCGYSTYKPKNFEVIEFLNKVDYDKYLNECDKVICHGGTGAIINTITKNKKVIAIPRLSEFGEHVDDHQKEIIKQFKDNNYIIGLENVDEIKEYINKIDDFKFNEYISNTENILNIIDDFIKN